MQIQFKSYNLLFSMTTIQDMIKAEINRWPHTGQQDDLYLFLKLNMI